MDLDVPAPVKPRPTPSIVKMKAEAGDKSAGDAGFRGSHPVSQKKSGLSICSAGSDHSLLGEGPLDEGGGELPTDAARDHPGSGAKGVMGSHDRSSGALGVDVDPCPGRLTAAGGDH